jgi:polysaccharide export outer membrane protein
MRPGLSRFALLLAVCTAAALAATACGGRTPFHDYAKEPDPQKLDLVLGIGDVVAINVWENRELSTEAAIRPDGMITMPLIGDLKAAGQTPAALKSTIKAKLVDYVKAPPGTEIVTVAVRAWRSYKFTIQGEVARQGVYTADGFVTVADALAMAGGLTRFAKRAEIKIFRRDAKTERRYTIPINYDDLTSGRRLDMNVWMLPGDVISVP